jgi:FkbM family methyltransferase
MPRATASGAVSPALILAQLVRGMPDFPGRDSVLAGLLRRVLRRDGAVRGHFGGGLRFEGNPALDSNVSEMMLLRYARPALAPVLDAALARGSVFADVGANLGLYTLWAARCVGAEGRVHAFEPMPEVRECLRRNLELNRFSCVEIVGSAVGAEPGQVTLNRVEGGSGRTSRYVDAAAGSLDVPVITLDGYFRDRPPPGLLKIDVEGMELQVLLGSRRLLASAAAPVVVFEAGTDLLAAAGVSYSELLGLLAENGGYRVFALTPRGLRAESSDSTTPGSLNVLALRPDLAAHERVREKLARHRFEANQNA